MFSGMSDLLLTLLNPIVTVGQRRVELCSHVEIQRNQSRKGRVVRAERIDVDRKDEFREMGDQSPLFRYVHPSDWDIHLPDT